MRVGQVSTMDNKLVMRAEIYWGRDSYRRVAAPDSLKNENICRDPKSLINFAIEHPTATPPITGHTLAVWDVWGDPNVLMV